VMADKITQKKKADIAVLKAAGYSNTETGKELGVSESTVRYHLKKIKKEAEEVGPIPSGSPRDCRGWAGLRVI